MKLTISAHGDNAISVYEHRSGVSLAPLKAPPESDTIHVATSSGDLLRFLLTDTGGWVVVPVSTASRVLVVQRPDGDQEVQLDGHYYWIGLVHPDVRTLEKLV